MSSGSTRHQRARSLQPPLRRLFEKADCVGGTSQLRGDHRRELNDIVRGTEYSIHGREAQRRVSPEAPVSRTRVVKGEDFENERNDDAARPESDAADL